MTDFEEIHDEVELKVKQALRRYKIERGILDPSTFTRKDLGVKARAEVYNGYDHGATNYEIQKAIEKVAEPANQESRREREASEFLRKIASKGFYGYLKLARLLGMPKESFVVRTWYGMYLPKIPNLVNPGGEVKLMEGTFNINAPISIVKNNVALRGVGAATILLAKADLSVGMIKVGDGTNPYSDITVENLQMDANRTNVKGNGIYFNSYVTRSTVRGCYIHSGYIFGVYLARSNRNYILDNFFSDARLYSLMVQGSCDNMIQGNVFYKDVGQSLEMPAYVAVPSVGNIINGNQFLESSSFPVYLLCVGAVFADNVVSLNGEEGVALEGARDCLIVGNVIRNNGTETPNAYDGILLISSDYNVIVGNRCFDDQATKTQRYGINISNAACDKNLLDGNILLGNLTGAYNDAGTGTVIGDNITA
jgi:parallel beta-helix repeat protein